MTHDLLHQFLNGNQSKQQDYSDFLRRFQQDPASISDAEAASRYHELLQHADPSAVADAYQHVLGQLPHDQRQQIAQQFQQAHQDPNSPFDGYTYSNPSQAASARSLGLMAHQAEQQSPDLLGKILGQDSPLNGPLGRLALAGVAAYLAHRVLSPQPSGQQQTSQSSGLSSGLSALGSLIGLLGHAQQQSGGQGSGVLGGLLDALGGQQQSGQSQGAPGGLGGLGGLLDALNNQQQSSQSQGAGGLGGLGGLLDALNNQQQSGQSQGAPGGLGGLGGLLDALGGQQQPATPATPAPAPAPSPDDGVSIPGLHVKGSSSEQKK